MAGELKAEKNAKRKKNAESAEEKPKKSLFKRAVTGLVTLATIGTIGAAVYVSGDNAQVSLSSNISQYWDQTRKDAVRAFKKNPGDILQQTLDLKKDVKGVLREYRSEVDAGTQDMAIESVISSLDDIANELRSAKTSEGNAEAARDQMNKAVIKYQSLFDLVNAQRDADEAVPQIKSMLKANEEPLKLAKEYDEGKLSAAEKIMQASIFAEGLEKTAKHLDVILKAYSTQKKARAELKHELQSGKSPTELVDGFTQALKRHAPYIDRKDLQEKVLEPTIAKLEAMNPETVQHDRAIAELYQTLKGMSKKEAYELRKEVDKKIKDPSIVAQLLVGDIEKVKRTPIHVRKKGAYDLIDVVSDTSATEAEEVAAYALGKVASPDSLVSVLTSRLDTLSPEDQMQAHLQIGELYNTLGTKVAQYQSPQMNKAGFPGTTSPLVQTPVDQEDKPAYKPAVPQQQSVKPQQRVQKDTRGFFEKVYDNTVDKLFD